jgi:3-hydroxy-D-aspartate aldolase
MRAGGRDGSRYSEFEHSPFVLASIISVPAADRASLDAGLKSYSAERGPPWVHNWSGLEVTGVSDEHGKVMVAPDAKRPSLGEKLWLIPGTAIRPSTCTTGISAFATGASRRSGPSVRAARASE